MKIYCSHEKLRDAVGTAERITGKNLALPVLAQIHLQTTNGGLQIAATNLNLGLEVEIPAKVENSGDYLVSGQTLYAFLQSIKTNTDVVIENANDSLKITTKETKTLIKTYPSEDFPSVPKIEGDVFEVSVKKILDALKSVSYAAALSDIKPEINSISLYFSNTECIAVATDSFRLAEKKIEYKTTQQEGVQVLIPFKNTQDIVRVLESAPDTIRCVVSKTQIAFYWPGVYVTSRLVDGVFPDYKQIIPNTSTTQAVFLKQDLLQALKTTALFSDTFNQVTFSLLVKEKNATLSSRNTEIGETNVSISGALSGEDVSFNLNGKYVLDCLQSITTDSVSISANGPQKAVILKGVGDPSFLYLVMPMNR